MEPNQIKPLVTQVFNQIKSHPVLEDWQKQIDAISIPTLTRLFTQPVSDTKLCDLAKEMHQQIIHFHTFNRLVLLIQFEAPQLPNEPITSNLNLLAKCYLELQANEDLTNIKHHRTDRVFLTDKERKYIDEHAKWIQSLLELIIKRLQDSQTDSLHIMDDWPLQMPFPLRKCPLTHNLEELSEHNHAIINPIPPIQRLHNDLHLQAQQLLYVIDSTDHYVLALEAYLQTMVLAAALENAIKTKIFGIELYNIYTDPLTDAFSRLKLLKDLKSHHPEKFALINISDFSGINVTFGPEIGDEVLKSLSHILRNQPEITHVYHLYADTFALQLLPNTTLTYRQLIERCETLLAQQGKFEFHIDLYIAYCEHCEKPLMSCEYGLLHAKKLKQSVINADGLSQSLHAEIEKRLSWTQKIKTGLADDRLILVFQPIKNLHTQQIEKYECLMRLKDENGELVPPSEFLPVLEKMFLYHEATRQVLWMAFQTFKDRPENFSVNLSLTDVKNPDLLPFLKGLADAYPETAQRCVIELLENEAFENTVEVESFIQHCKTLGFKIAIDDFGSGYSNFAYLFQLPIDFIKLDGSLIQNLTDPKIRTLCAHVVEMAHEMNIQVIAEFVSSAERLTAVESIDSDYAQGYEIGKPEPVLLEPEVFH
jgi:EAL domain-containing protein (putative c-di-GMP-specific phosphodiesterase class I)